jgi:sugar lactone lactonase YvrE
VIEARPACSAVYQLGEGPLWDPLRNRLLWVDIPAGRVHAGTLDGLTVTPTDTWSFGEFTGAVAVSAAGDLLVAERETLTVGGRPVARVLEPGVPSRLNDGAVDPAGRFLVGSMALDDRRGAEVLVRLDGDRCTVLDSDLTLSNGLAWSPAGDRLYSIDTVPGIVWGRAYDPVTGACGPRQEQFRVTDGSPDGMCTDVNGNLWIAIWDGSRVECRTPAGELLETVSVDAPHTSSAAFAGPGLDILVITTATPGNSPLSGRLFTARPGVTGLPVPYWNPTHS